MAEQEKALKALRNIGANIEKKVRPHQDSRIIPLMSSTPMATVGSYRSRSD
jgi:hypothetical protein